MTKETYFPSQCVTRNFVPHRSHVLLKGRQAPPTPVSSDKAVDIFQVLKTDPLIQSKIGPQFNEDRMDQIIL